MAAIASWCHTIALSGGIDIARASASGLPRVEYNLAFTVTCFSSFPRIFSRVLIAELVVELHIDKRQFLGAGQFPPSGS